MGWGGWQGGKGQKAPQQQVSKGYGKQSPSPSPHAAQQTTQQPRVVKGGHSTVQTPAHNPYAAATATPRTQQVLPSSAPRLQQSPEVQNEEVRGEDPSAAEGIPNELLVSGCAHPVVGTVVNGNYGKIGDNHGRPVFQRDKQVEGANGTSHPVMIYFWDARDGPSLCGWWLGAKVGGDQAWGYNPDGEAMLPPKKGWRIPHDGPVDDGLDVAPREPPPPPAALPMPQAYVAPAGPAQDEEVGNANRIIITGCTHGNVAKHLNGSYTRHTVNHGRPAFRKDEKVNDLDTMLYFWDARDGVNFSGWWFGPEIGGDKVMAHQPTHSQTPPTSGWKVPHNGTVDPKTVISVYAGGMGSPGGVQQADPKIHQQRQLEQQRQVQLEKARKQLEEHRKAREDVVKRQNEEAQKRKAEQDAVGKVRAVIEKVKTANPDTLTELQKELEEVQVELGNVGALKDQLQKECDLALMLALKQTEQVREKTKEVEIAVEISEQMVMKIGARGQSVQREAKGASAPALLKLGAEMGQMVKEARDSIQSARGKVAEFRNSKEEKFKAWLEGQSQKFEERLQATEEALGGAEPALQAVREAASDKADALEALALSVLKYHQRANGISNDSLFEQLDGDKDGLIVEEDFVAFFDKCDRDSENPRPGPTKEDLKCVFGGFEKAEDGKVAKPVFMKFLKEFMKVVRGTALTSACNITDSKTVRKVKKGEIVEVLEGPKREYHLEVMRIRTRAVADGAEGWITIESNAGASFLEEGGTVFKYKVTNGGTVLTETCSYKLKASNKSLKAGEIVVVREAARKDERSGLMRLPCRVKSDGRSGWVTTVDLEGEPLIEPV